MKGQDPMSGCSKGARGLSVQSRVSGIFTAATVSPSSCWRQQSSRYTIRAGRNFMWSAITRGIDYTFIWPRRHETPPSDSSLPSYWHHQRGPEPACYGAGAPSRDLTPESLRGSHRAILPSVLPSARLRAPVGFHRFEPVLWTGSLPPRAISLTRQGISLP